MEKEKKTTKKPVKKAVKTTADKKVAPTKEKVQKQSKETVKVEKVQVAPVKDTKALEDVKVVQEQPKAKITLNQELNLLIGLLGLITIISFCFVFQGGDVEVLGWELFLQAGEYSGVFKGLMILYVVSIFIDCILTIRVDSENEIFNIVEKALYMFTAIMNVVVVTVLLSIISKVGIGLIIFFIISVVNSIIKFGRIFAQK